MKHIFREGRKDRPVLLLLHGTGGTEQDLLPLAGLIDKEASVLSVRGNVLENGMPRFFRRLEEGVFDHEDLVKRTEELHTFLDEAADYYQFERDNVIAVGYSNGANIAGSLIFHYENSLKGAILHHPMVPVKDSTLPKIKGLPVFIGAGENDPICEPEETKELKAILEKAEAEVELFWENQGHQLTEREVQAAAKWYESQFLAFE
ncbi:alpha/beta hydrolase [Salsuginibacillus kocurii]|uniref:alpha/beta hydrolase n=1 Tax=Salsuginibacillus kocurii TaxID=427078 RepID=UPI0004781FAE|nr:alpha/beta hydrolase [Salsuginibacillus kocurii]